MMQTPHSNGIFAAVSVGSGRARKQCPRAHFIIFLDIFDKNSL
jgi:hypothetical protein